MINDILDEYNNIDFKPSWYLKVLECLTEEEKRIFLVYSNFYSESGRHIILTAEYFNTDKYSVIITINKCREKIKESLKDSKINKYEYYD